MPQRTRAWLATAFALPAVTVLAVATGALSPTAAVADPPMTAGAVIEMSSAVFTIGVPTTATFSPQSVGGPAASYAYTVNGETKTVKAHSGTATVTLDFTTRTNVLTVVGLGADGSTSVSATEFLLAGGATEATPQDSNGDGFPDLLTTGGTAGLGSGIWLADGKSGGAATGRLHVPATNVGADGISDGNPTYFDGAEIITGDFLGNNLQDVMVYFPNGFKAGGGVLLSGTGDGSALSAGSGDELNLNSGTFADVNGDNPIELTNAYDATGNGVQIADLMGVSGDPTNGYSLMYYQDPAGGPLTYAVETTGAATPTGGHDWNNWRIASTQIVANSPLQGGTQVVLWNTVTGALYLWSGVTFTDSGDLTSGTLSYTQYQISKKWNVGADVSTFEVTDFVADGVPDIWTVTSTGVARAYVVSGLSETGLGTIAAKAPQNLF